MAVSPLLSPGKRLKLWWGKVRRFYLGSLRPRYVRQQAERRAGECRRCGACCQLGLYCWSLRNHQPVAECKRHTTRPMNCRIFPVDERDLRDRDLIAPGTACGFHFNGTPTAAGGSRPPLD